jgi:hypothetical protein
MNIAIRILLTSSRALLVAALLLLALLDRAFGQALGALPLATSRRASVLSFSQSSKFLSVFIIKMIYKM